MHKEKMSYAQYKEILFLEEKIEKQATLAR